MSFKDDLSKAFGDNIVLTGNAIVDQKVLTIPVSPSLDIILNGGIPEGSFVILTGQPKCGKLQGLSDIIYTPDGPSTMGDMKIGTIVCTPDGKTAKVIGIYPQGKQDLYRITFNDGSSTRCGLEHNWTVSKNNRKTKYITITLQDILNEGLRYNDRWKWKIPLTQPVYFKQTKKLILDPYILGCLIGDGGLTQKTPRFTTSDTFIANKFKRFCRKRELSFKHINRYDYSISGKSESNILTKNTLTRDLKILGLMGCSSHNKFIPNRYKYASLSNRLSFIRGLMDTDGYNDKGLRAEYSTVSLRLANDAKELLEGLGYSVVLTQRTTQYNQKTFLSYRLCIHGNNIDQLFNLPRKKSGNKRIKPDLFRTIVDVQKVSNEETQCIEIDNENGLYLTDNFIVTHNTTTSLDFAATAQKPEYQGDLKSPREVYYLNVEGRLKKRDLEGIPHLDLTRFHVVGSQQGKILHGEEYLQIAEKIINEIPGSILIIDSYSALCTEAEITSEMDKMQRADGAKLLKKFCRKVANVIPVNKNIVIGITHLMGNPTGYGAEFKEGGGQGIAYQTDVKLRAKSVKPWLLSADSTQIGQEVEWQVLCSALGGPGGVMTGYIRYGQGIDKITELINIASDMGLIHKGGAWYTLTSLSDKPKFQGVEKVRIYLSENPKIYDELLKSVKETMNIK